MNNASAIRIFSRLLVDVEQLEPNARLTLK